MGFFLPFFVKGPGREVDVGPKGGKTSRKMELGDALVVVERALPARLFVCQDVRTSGS